MAIKSFFGKIKNPANSGGQRQQYPVGRMGRSQAITTFGIGSIYELRTFRDGRSTLHSVMIAGLDTWDADRLPVIHEPVLQHLLKVRKFRLPPVEQRTLTGGVNPDGPAVPAVRFPRWLVCSKCNRLGVVGREFDDAGFWGPRCKANGARGCGHGVPVRLVVACFDPHAPAEGEERPDAGQHPGHIDDFPWVWWAHSESREGICENPQLKLETQAGSTGLAGLRVVCHSSQCGGRVGRSLEGVFGAYALERRSCAGSRPWLGDRQDGCPRRIRALLRGASNVYFPVLVSALSIPPFSNRLFQLLSGCPDIVANVGDPNFSDAQLAILARNALSSLRREGYSDEQIVAVLQALASGQTQDSLPDNSEEMRARERTALIQGQLPSDDPEASKVQDEFIAEPLGSELPDTSLGLVLDALVRVHRLREVRVLRGFQRVDPIYGGDPFTMECAPLSRTLQNWLPAIEVRGEGLYFELSHERLQNWEMSDPVQQRFQRLLANYRQMCANRHIDPEASPPSARTVLAHTLSHLLMKQLSLECGYSSASLRERLYIGDEWAGALIYTATPGADGTLGGLVSQGDPERFLGILRAAVENARWCSSDPLCIESEGQGADALNLAACHACALVSETSCEQRNLYLDRALIVGLPGSPETGFFHGTEFLA
ncbi:MAG: DUF1998 domain-containing protein [Candidatus Competibacter sp.]|nr:DUF1998 domain-containing protein [Candidatus Competibacter sp.]